MIAADDLAAALRVVAEAAQRLREAGVLEVTADGVHVRLAPQAVAASVERPKDQPVKNPFDDPSAYGLPPGADVPGLPWFREEQQRAAGAGK